MMYVVIRYQSLGDNQRRWCHVIKVEEYMYPGSSTHDSVLPDVYYNLDGRSKAYNMQYAGVVSWELCTDQTLLEEIKKAQDWVKEPVQKERKEYKFLTQYRKGITILDAARRLVLSAPGETRNFLMGLIARTAAGEPVYEDEYNRLYQIIEDAQKEVK